MTPCPPLPFPCISINRGLGIGTALMKEMLCIMKDGGYKQASLSVQKANYAVRMYLNRI